MPCRQRYIMTSREVKRWDATSRSPVYASLSTTLKVWAMSSGLHHCLHMQQTRLESVTDMACLLSPYCRTPFFVLA
jgi:hypothetical protein